jgi:NADH-quinone oxidoreductase subunit M
MTKEENKSVPDIAWNEVVAMVPLVIMMVWIGVHPSTFLKKMSPSVNELLAVVKSETKGKVYVADLRGARVPPPAPAPREVSK